MSTFDETISRLDEGSRYANLYYQAAMARCDTLRELMAQIEAAGGVEHAKRPLADAMQAAVDLAENLRYSQQSLRQASRYKRDARDPDEDASRPR
jgi:hypothetical protein